MIRIFRMLIVLLAAVLPILFSKTAFSDQKIVARVGNTEIRENLLSDEVERYIPPGGYHSDISRMQREKYWQDALNNLIEIELLYIYAKSSGIEIKDEQIDRIIDDNIKRFGSKKNFLESLKKKGFTLDFFRERAKKVNTANAILGELFKKSEYTEKELKEYYELNRAKYKRPESIHLYHIHIKVEPNATEKEWIEKKEYANGILKRIKAGEDFGTIAYNYSDDRFRFKSGDYGFIHRGQLTPQELEDTAFSLKEGEISGVIRTIYGFHILKAGEKRPAETMGFDDVKGKIGKELQIKRFEERKKGLLDSLKRDYPVEIFIKFGEVETDRKK